MMRELRLMRMLLCILLVLALVLCCGCKKSELVEVAPVEEEPEPVYEGPQGYLSSAPLGDGFVACGTGGRVDLIALDGTVTTCETGTTATLFSVFTEDNNVAVAGENGTLLISTDAGATFRQADIKTELDLYGAVVYQGTMYAAGEAGRIFRQNDKGWEEIPMATSQTLIGLAVTVDRLVAISAETDVFISEDGEEWEYQNFNKVYDGMYPPYVFTRLVGAGETFFVLGYPAEMPNKPLIMYTSYGDVWMQKELMMLNGEYVTGEENLFIYDICFNIDQIVGVLNDGEILSITNCIKCNESTKLDTDKDLWTTSVQEGGVLVCGEDFFSYVIDGKQIRQDKIQAEQAKYEIDNYGAYLIDVREDDELIADGYIPGSIHIPLAEVEERLPEVVPDLYDEIIFYCASGKRSQTATELAVEMGYASVYNLGGLSDWPYEIEFPENSSEEAAEAPAEEPAE